MDGECCDIYLRVGMPASVCVHMVPFSLSLKSGLDTQGVGAAKKEMKIVSYMCWNAGISLGFLLSAVGKASACARVC